MPNPNVRHRLVETYPNYLDLNFATLPDGPVPGMLGATWDVASGKARNNVTIEPAELLLNGGFDTDTSNWTTPASGTIASVTGGESGNCCELTRVSGTTQEIVQTATMAIGDWVYLSPFVKSGTSGNELCHILLQGNASPYDYTSRFVITTTGSWTQYAIVGRCLATNMRLCRILKYSATAGTMLFDTTSAKKMTPSSFFSLRKFSSQYGSIKASWTATAGKCCMMGAVMCANKIFNPTSYVSVTQDASGNINMDKCVNGAYTALVYTAKGYVAGRNVMIRRIPGTNTFQAWYGAAGSEAQVGTDQTINDPEIIGNRYHGLFDTSPQLNTCSRFIYNAAG
jgi:hypothetical protein